MQTDAAHTAELSSVNIRQLLSKFTKPHLGSAIWQLLNTLSPFFMLWALMVWSVVDGWAYGWTLLLALPTAGLYVRIFIFQHDCGHGSYFASEKANQFVGAALGVITLFPYGYWKVSTARRGYYTPRGSYSVKRMAKVYYSRKYDNSPMPNSIFFHGGYAIHGSNYVKSLGRPASHGCVRLHPSNAARLYALVQRYGASRTRVTLVN